MKKIKLSTAKIFICIFVILQLFCYSKEDKNDRVNVNLKIDSSDVDLFYEVLEHAEKNNIPLDKDYIYEEYLLKGSPALEELISFSTYGAKRNNRTEGIREILWEDYFKKNIDFLKDNKEEILKNRDYLIQEEPVKKVEEKLSRFLNRDFDSTFYFIIGRGNMYGTATDKGIVLDVAMTRSDKIDYSKHPYPSFVNLLSVKEDTIFVFVHELMHQFQLYGLKRDNIEENLKIKPLSATILNEGGGHFFAKVLLEEKYLPRHYLDPKKHFEKNPHIIKEMIYNRNINTHSKNGGKVMTKYFFDFLEDRENGAPPDMGYFLGSVIAEDYYNKAKDKRKAFNEVIEYWNYKDQIIDSYMEDFESDFYLGESIAKGKAGETEYEVYTHRPLFEKFWRLSRNKTEEEKLEIFYKEYLSKIGYQYYLDYAFIELKLGGNFNEKLDKAVLEQLKKLEDGSNYEKFIEKMKVAEKEWVENDVRKTLEYYGKFGKKQYVVLSVIGNAYGAARLLRGETEKPLFLVNFNRWYLSSLGEENFDFKKKFNQMITHEISHNYHMSLNGNFGKLKTKDFLERGKIYWFLFIEGMGTYGEFKINNGEFYDFIKTFDKGYENFTEEDIKLFAKEYLKVQNHIFFENVEENRKWTSRFNEKVNGKQYDLPGLHYIIGLKLVEDLVERKNISYEKLAKYELGSKELQNEIVDSLEHLSK